MRKFLSHPGIRAFFKLGVSVSIIWLVFRQIDEQQALAALRQAQPAWLLWATLWFVASKWIGAVRFSHLIQLEGIRLEYWTNLRLNWLGMYYNLLLPGGVSGDAYKIKLLKKAHGSSISRLFAVTLFDRLGGVIALGQICLLLLLSLPPTRPYSVVWLLLFFISIPASYVTFRLLVANQAARLLPVGEADAPATGADTRLTEAWIRTSGQSLAVQLAQVVSAIGILFALGESANWLGYSVLFLVSSVAAMLPLTIGGTGARELTFLWGAAFLQLNEERAVAVAFLFYLISTLIAFVGIVFSFKSNLLSTTSAK